MSTAAAGGGSEKTGRTPGFGEESQFAYNTLTVRRGPASAFIGGGRRL